MTAKLILAIDQGTTGSTCLLVDANLHVRARATHDFPQHFPRPGLVEHDPEELWASVLSGIADVRAQLNDAPHEIVAVGITTARDEPHLVPRGRRPIHRALVWQDRRTADRRQALERAGHPT